MVFFGVRAFDVLNFELGRGEIRVLIGPNCSGTSTLFNILSGLFQAVYGAVAYGDLKKLELAIALANDPELLLLDEPTAGMAPAERGALMALTASIARERTLTVLFTEHDMDVVFTVAERVMVLHQGRVIAEGAPDTVRADPEVQAVYLGEAAWAT